MDETSPLFKPSARYDWFGWSVDAAPVEVAAGRLAETHEYFHRQLDDTTSFGGLMTTVAALADSVASVDWLAMRDQLKAMCDVVHESFAVGMSLLTTQRAIGPIPGYPAYDRYARVVTGLIGSEVHPWVALAALRAAATATMQSTALTIAADVGLSAFEPKSLGRMERPNHRLMSLMNAGFRDHVRAAHDAAAAEHGAAGWWQPSDGVLLPIEAMQGPAAEASANLHLQLLGDAQRIIEEAAGRTVGTAEYHAALRSALMHAHALAPDGLTRIGALVESPGGELAHGGALDSQTIRLTAAPDRVVVLPYGSASGLSGEGGSAHAFVVLTRPDRVRRGFARVEGLSLPETASAAFYRSTVYDGDRRDCVLHILLDDPQQVRDEVPIYLMVHSSASAVDPETAARWMQWADPDRVSLVMDTPSSAAIIRWCANGARFRMQTRAIKVEGMEVRIIAGRVEDGLCRSPLVIIPTTEFGARWFEAARAEHPALSSVVQEDDTFFGQHEDHLDIALNHLLYEERFVGTGSWRK